MSQKDKNLNNNIKNFEKATVEKDKYLSGWDLYKQLLSNKNLSEKNLIELAKVFKGVSSLSNIYQHPNTKKEVKQYIKQNIKEHLNFTIDLYNMINSSEKKEDIKQITKQMTNGNHMDIKALITIKY